MLCLESRLKVAKFQIVKDKASSKRLIIKTIPHWGFYILEEVPIRNDTKLNCFFYCTKLFFFFLLISLRLAKTKKNVGHLKIPDDKRKRVISLPYCIASTLFVPVDFRIHRVINSGSVTRVDCKSTVNASGIRRSPTAGKFSDCRGCEKSGTKTKQ